MKNKKLEVVIFCLLSSSLNAQEVGHTAGLILQRTSASRPSALGDAFTSATDDIAALTFNPASVGTLKSPQMSFQHQEGLFSDTYSQLMYGSKMPNGNFGLSVGMYDSGKVTLYDGNTTRSVVAQRDMLVQAAYGFKTGGGVAWGTSLKYLSSKLAEAEGGQAVAMDFGVNVPLNTQWNAGFSIAPFPSKIKYASVEEDLPQSARAGFSYKTKFAVTEDTQLPVLLLADLPYSYDSRGISPSIGAEASVGMMSIRMGYKTNRDLEGFTVGMGVFVRNISLDYAFGLVDQKSLNSVHNVSVSMRFGNGFNSPSSSPIVKQEQPGTVQSASSSDTPLTFISGSEE